MGIWNFCRDCKYHDHLIISEHKDKYGQRYVLVKCEKKAKRYLPSDFNWKHRDVTFKQDCPLFVPKQMTLEELE